MTRRRRRPRLPQGEFPAVIDSMAHDGRGVAHIDGKATFIQGGLPGEQVNFRYLSTRRSHDEGVVVSVSKASPLRIEPHCAHYSTCGGCSLQHLDAIAQIEAKQGILLDNLQHIGKVTPAEVLPPLLNDSPWGYRRKARLGVKYVAKKGKVLVGFRERGSSLIADISQCHVLHPRVGLRLLDLAELIASLSIRERVPQIEMAMDDQRCVLIFRILDPLSAEDHQRLLEFAEQFEIIPYLQPAGPDSVTPLTGEPSRLYYELPDQHLELDFLPGDFTQVNTDINRKMINRALQMLSPQADDQILDLFCGVGNFTLPLARYAGRVVGVEGDPGLVQRARDNAAANQLSHVEFFTANLYETLAPAAWLEQRYQKALIDPPRSGAQEVLPLLPQLGVETLLYISCYPGTLARDAGLLVNEHGYKLLSAGVMDMFPHTSHVESIALFKRG